MPVEIIRLTTEGASLLDAVEEDVFDNDIDPDALAAFLADPRHVMLIAVDGDDGRGARVVGMASAFDYFHPDKKPQMFINEVGVAPAWRRRGLGRRLVAALLAEAKARGCVYAWLGTDADNVGGKACFGSVSGGEAPQPFLLYEWSLEGD
ncbi:MAG: GNAT family N-acetyltransferase [Alphaproteobacteria bacterium]|nr:GNAT family N-acetyltransferase [Alphaproteobacteria bacterium]